MKRLAILLALCSWCCARVAWASPTSEDTRACITASTAGQTERDEGHLLAARAGFLACAEQTCPTIVQKSCADWLRALEPRIPSVVLRVDEDFHGEVRDASAVIDGNPVALDGRAQALDPGTHSITVSAPGWLPVERSVLLAEREQGRLVVVRLEHREVPVQRAARMVVAPAPPQREPERPALHYRPPTAGWLLAGAGVAGVVTFAVLRRQARHDLDALVRECSPSCSQRQTDQGNRKTLAADISLGVGISAFAGAGAWMLGSWLWQRRAAPDDRRAVLLVPTRGGAFASLAARY